jgi:hypothetical protein
MRELKIKSIEPNLMAIVVGYWQAKVPESDLIAQHMPGVAGEHRLHQREADLGVLKRMMGG